MKIAVPFWNGHVATVFEAADEMVVIESLPGGDRVQRMEFPKRSSTLERAAHLKSLGIDALICGALSRPLAHRVEAAGIRLIPFVRGPVDEVVNAFREETLDGERYLLPGCRSAFNKRGAPCRRRRGRAEAPDS
jgi:predicted Fe-Mo cluster-binding NifX family protein